MYYYTDAKQLLRDIANRMARRLLKYGKVPLCTLFQYPNLLLQNKHSNLYIGYNNKQRSSLWVWVMQVLSQ